MNTMIRKSVIFAVIVTVVVFSGCVSSVQNSDSSSEPIRTSVEPESMSDRPGTLTNESVSNYVKKLRKNVQIQ